MLVRDVMNTHVYSCTIDQRASDAMRLMVQFDIGCVPVIDAQRRPLGMVTDRDIARAACQTNRPPQLIDVRSAMSRGVFSCDARDELSEAERTMHDHQVHRLVVIAHDGTLCGVLSLTDIALAAETSPLRVRGELEHTLASLVRHRARPVGAQF